MPEGLVTLPSARGFAETLQGLVDALDQRHVQVFARIDHALNAREAGLELRPTTVVVFGAAQGGTPLMQAEQALGLDLPLRALVYEDAEGEVFVAYNEPAWIVARHGLEPSAFAPVAGMSRLLADVARQAGGAASPHA